MQECACTLIECWPSVAVALFVGALIGMFIISVVSIVREEREKGDGGHPEDY